MAEKKTIELEIKSNLGDAEKSLGSLKSQLRQAQAEVGALSDKFGATSKEAVNAAKKAAELADRIGDAKALTDAFNPDAKFRALSGALSGVAGGFSAVTGVMGALGAESKDVEAAILKVQSAMAISSGLQAVGESVDQFKILATVIKNTSIAQRALTIYQTAYNYVNAATTTGLKLLRGAMISTGIGALVVAVGMLIANFDKVKDTILRVIPALSLVGDGVMFVVHAITDFIGATSEAEREVERLSAAAAKSLKNNEQYLKEHGSQLDEYTKQKIAAKNEYLKLVEEDGANQRAYALELNRKLKKIDDDRLKSKKENKKEEVKTVKETNKEISEEEQKRLADEMQSATNAIAILDEIEKAKETPAQKELREYNEKKAVLEANNLSTEELTKQHLDKLAEIKKTVEEKAAEDKRKADEEAAAEAKKIADFIIEQEEYKESKKKEITDKGIAFLNVIAGKNKAIQKAAVIAEGIVSVARSVKNTIEGNASTFAKSIATLGPIAGPPAAAPAIALNTAAGSLSVATTIAQTAKALQALGGGGGGVSGSVGGGVGGGGGSSAPPSVAFNNSAENQIGQSVAKTQGDQPPLQVTVLESDITKAQNNVSVLVNKNKF